MRLIVVVSFVAVVKLLLLLMKHILMFTFLKLSIFALVIIFNDFGYIFSILVELEIDLA